MRSSIINHDSPNAVQIMSPHDSEKHSNAPSRLFTISFPFAQIHPNAMQATRWACTASKPSSSPAQIALMDHLTRHAALTQMLKHSGDQITASVCITRACLPYFMLVLRQAVREACVRSCVNSRWLADGNHFDTPHLLFLLSRSPFRPFLELKDNPSAPRVF